MPLITWVGYCSDGEQSNDGTYYNSNGESWTSEENVSLDNNEDGTTSVDEEKEAPLMNAWRLADALLHGTSANEYLEPDPKAEEAGS